MPVDDYGVKSGLMHLYQLDAFPKKKDFAPITDYGPRIERSELGIYGDWQMLKRNPHERGLRRRIFLGESHLQGTVRQWRLTFPIGIENLLGALG